MWPLSREAKFVRFCIILLFVVEVTFIILVYTIGGVQGTLEYPRIYISDTFVDDPGRAIATFLLPLTAFLIVIIIGLRLNRIQPLLRSKWDLFLWYGSIFMLAGAFVGRTGIAAVPIPTNTYLHAVAAFMLYICSVFLYTLLTILDDSVGLDRSQNMRHLRMVLCGSMWVFGLTLAITVGWMDYVGPIAQLLLSGLFLNYILTYYTKSEFRMLSTFGPKDPDPQFLADTPPCAHQGASESYLIHIHSV